MQLRSQMPNQMVRTHVVPAVGSQVNQVADVGAAVVNQGVGAASGVNQATDDAAGSESGCSNV